jgi:hypothetical protein
VQLGRGIFGDRTFVRRSPRKRASSSGDTGTGESRGRPARSRDAEGATNLMGGTVQAAAPVARTDANGRSLLRDRGGGTEGQEPKRTVAGTGSSSVGGATPRAHLPNPRTSLRRRRRRRKTARTGNTSRLRVQRLTDQKTTGLRAGSRPSATTSQNSRVWRDR